MKLLLLGSTGRTGSALLDLAVSRGHDVTAFVRSPEKLVAARSVSVAVGHPLDVDALRAALPGHEAVVSTLGQHGRSVLRPSTLMSAFGRATVRAMTMTDVTRLVVVSAAVLFPPHGIGARLAGWVLRHHAHDLRAMEDTITRSTLQWTIVRPPRLVGGASDHYVASADGLPAGGAALSFRAVATSMLDEVERGTHIRQIVGLAS